MAFSSVPLCDRPRGVVMIPVSCERQAGSYRKRKQRWFDGDEAPPAQTIKATFVEPPGVPPAIDHSKPARVVVEMETTEQKGTLADGVEYPFWTFGGTVPGPMLRVRQGDTVEIRLTNRKDSHLMHSIDLHAVTGPGGGAAVTQVMPGETGAFEWKALNPGCTSITARRPTCPCTSPTACTA